MKRRRDHAALTELPIASLAALTANINRDSKAAPEPYKPIDFCFYRDRDDSDAVFDAEVAAVALALRHEDRCPPLLLAAWPQIIASSRESTSSPPRRALRSDDDAVWVLAPRPEGPNIRGGLVAVRGRISGPVLLRDIDRPLLTYELVLPARGGFGWLEARCLLLSAESSGHGVATTAGRLGNGPSPVSR